MLNGSDPSNLAIPMYYEFKKDVFWKTKISQLNDNTLINGQPWSELKALVWNMNQLEYE